MKSVIVRDVEVGCSSIIIIIVLKIDYEVLTTAHSLDDFKECVSPLLYDVTPS